MTKLRLREVKQLPKNTQQVSDRARIPAQVYLIPKDGVLDQSHKKRPSTQGQLWVLQVQKKKVKI